MLYIKNYIYKSYAAYRKQLKPIAWYGKFAEFLSIWDVIY